MTMTNMNSADEEAVRDYMRSDEFVDGATIDATEEELREMLRSDAQKPQPKKRTLLETWQHLLANIDTEKHERITMQMAGRVVGSWPQLKMSEVPAYFKFYYELLGEMRDALEDIIAENEEALTKVENDAEDNKTLYTEVVISWQQLTILWDRDWDVNSETAHIEMAAIADASLYYLGPDGIINHLNNIGVLFNEAEQREMYELLVAWQEAL